jgi:RimJ/RimL family protein N-acetyltransferase
MLQGERVQLRLVRETDLDCLHDFHADISNRGDFFPVGVVSLPTFQEQFRKSGFWEKTEGMLIIAGEGDSILGHIEFFETVNYLDEIELSYIIYSPDDAGRGIATEAVTLLSGYLFDAKKINRIRLVIHPDNRASRRVAEKAGFTYEGVARGAWYHQGRNHDVEVWSLLRAEHAGALAPSTSS